MFRVVQHVLNHVFLNDAQILGQLLVGDFLLSGVGQNLPEPGFVSFKRSVKATSTYHDPERVHHGGQSGHGQYGDIRNRHRRDHDVPLQVRYLVCTQTPFNTFDDLFCVRNLLWGSPFCLGFIEQGLYALPIIAEHTGVLPAVRRLADVAVHNLGHVLFLELGEFIGVIFVDEVEYPGVDGHVVWAEVNVVLLQLAAYFQTIRRPYHFDKVIDGLFFHLAFTFRGHDLPELNFIGQDLLHAPDSRPVIFNFGNVLPFLFTSHFIDGLQPLYTTLTKLELIAVHFLEKGPHIPFKLITGGLHRLQVDQRSPHIFFRHVVVD